jgi:hypothetical protein
MEAKDWLKGVEKKLVIAQCMDHEKLLFVTHQLYGTADNCWETYCNTHSNVDTIMWNEFKAVFFCTHYVPRGTMKLRKKEFTDLTQWPCRPKTHSFSYQDTPLTTSTLMKRNMTCS